MERTTFSLLFYIRRNKLNKNGEAPVFMRLTVNGQRADASVKRFIAPRLWNTAKGKAHEKTREGKDLNLYLDAISANILRIQRDMELDRLEVSAQTILDRYLGKTNSDRHTLMEVFRAHNEKCKALSGISFAPGTVIRYETSLRLTGEFMRNTYKKEDMYLDELSAQFVEDYEFYLKTVRKCCHNTTAKYLMNFKKIIRIAEERPVRSNPVSSGTGRTGLPRKARIENPARQKDRDCASGAGTRYFRILLPDRTGLYGCPATETGTHRYGHQRYEVDSQGTSENPKYVQHSFVGRSTEDSGALRG